MTDPVEGDDFAITHSASRAVAIHTKSGRVFTWNFARARTKMDMRGAMTVRAGGGEGKFRTMDVDQMGVDLLWAYIEKHGLNEP